MHRSLSAIELLGMLVTWMLVTVFPPDGRR